MIKSRNRVKGPPGGQKKKPNLSPAPGPLSTTHPDAPARGSGSEHSPRSSTPSQLTHPANIAPQHIFDNSTFSQYPPHPQPLLQRAQTPSSNEESAPPSYEALLEENKRLRTRVSELEVINDLFQGRVSELEHSDSELRRALQQGNTAAPAPAVTSADRPAGDKRKADDAASNGSQDSSTKRMRMSDLVREEPAAEPAAEQAAP